MQGSQGSVLDVGRAGWGKVGPETMELKAETKRKHRSTFTLILCKSRSRWSKAATYPARYQCGPEFSDTGVCIFDPRIGCTGNGRDAR